MPESIIFSRREFIALSASAALVVSDGKREAGAGRFEGKPWYAVMRRCGQIN
jgi:hypothetical protein